MFFSDVTMYTEGPLGNKLKEAPKHINWSLMSKIAKILNFLGELQNKEMPLEPEPALQKFFAVGMVGKEEKELMDESKKWEPPQRRGQQAQQQ